MRAALLVAIVGCGRVGFGRVGFDATTSTDGGGDGVAADYASTVLADHPIAYYRLDEVSGAVARDSSGHGNDGQYGATPGQITYSQPGALANDPDTAVGLAGDGGATTASVAPPPAAFVFAGDFTVEGFVRPTQPAPGVNDAFFAWEIYNQRGFRTGWTEQMMPQLWTGESGGAAPSVDGAMPLVAGAWVHLAFVHAGATFSIYVAGQLVASGAPAFVTPLASDNGWLGSNQGMPAGSAYDELAIYDHALTAQQIAAHHAASL